MLRCSLLPASLLALLFAFPAFAVPSSPNDQFREIALKVVKEPEPPVCCLNPLEPVRPPKEEDVLLSFDDWKARRLGELKDPSARLPGGESATTSVAHGPTQLADSTVVAGQPQDIVSNGSQQEMTDTNQQEERLSPHFRIPTVDRFNYASTDCSARVHTAHHSAKSPSSILSSKKDRYMLSPCAEQKQFVVVELCDDIMIDTVQLANFEFFSGVFKDFTVSVAKTYTTDEEGWIDAGTYRAENTRGVQSFHPPPALRDFYRFIRIDFLSHYGNEYYCPLSLFRVYGLTHLEQWKWDEWEAQSHARRAAEEASASMEMAVAPPQIAHAAVVEPVLPPKVAEKAQSSTTAQATQTPYASATVTPAEVSSSNVFAPSPSPSISEAAKTVRGSSSEEPDQETTLSLSYYIEINTASSRAHEAVTADSPAETTSDDNNLSSKMDIPLDEENHSSANTLYNTTDLSTSTQLFPSPVPSVDQANPSSVQDSSDTIKVSSESPPMTSSIRLTTSSSNSVVSPSIVSASLAQPFSPPAPQVPTGGESIYRTIMNRITALEGNTTLYARYVEEQTAGMRDILRHLGEDVGRLEGIGKAQAQMYQRSISEFDRHRRRLELEHRELLSRVNRLTDEVVLEKRLGIAQLCLLLAIMVFITLTRGSRGELHRIPALGRPLNMRDWGRRTLSLSLSGDWVSKFRSPSPTVKSVAQSTNHPPEKKSSAMLANDQKCVETHNAGSVHVEFPSQEVQVPESPSPLRHRRKLHPRPHTPSTLRVSTSRHQNLYMYTRPTPFSAMTRPLLTRSSSGGVDLIGPMPRSAKRWARSAHLHEVKSAGPVLSGRREAGNPEPLAPVDVFSSQAGPLHPKAKGKVRSRDADARYALSPLRFSSSRELPGGCVRSESSTEGGASEGEGEGEGEGWMDMDSDSE